MTVLRLERQVVVANVLIIFQGSKGLFTSLNILERADFPELLIYKLIARVTQHIDQVWVDISNRARPGIQN